MSLLCDVHQGPTLADVVFKCPDCRRRFDEATARALAKGPQVVSLRRYGEDLVRECLTDILPYWVHADAAEGADVERTVAYLVDEILRRLRKASAA